MFVCFTDLNWKLSELGPSLRSACTWTLIKGFRVSSGLQRHCCTRNIYQFLAIIIPSWRCTETQKRLFGERKAHYKLAELLVLACVGIILLYMIILVTKETSEQLLTYCWFVCQLNFLEKTKKINLGKLEDQNGHINYFSLFFYNRDTLHASANYCWSIWNINIKSFNWKHISWEFQFFSCVLRPPRFSYILLKASALGHTIFSSGWCK